VQVLVRLVLGWEPAGAVFGRERGPALVVSEKVPVGLVLGQAPVGLVLGQAPEGLALGLLLGWEPLVMPALQAHHARQQLFAASGLLPFSAPPQLLLAQRKGGPLLLQGLQWLQRAVGSSQALAASLPELLGCC